jgi:hypothetical protein
VYRILGERAAGDFRVPEPRRSAAGDWVAGDPETGAWVAWQWLPGQPADWAGLSPRWSRLVAVSRAFHAALAGLPAPPWLGRDGTPWTVADQVAWGDRDPEDILADGRGAPAGLNGQVRRLLAALRPVRVSDQLVHGDLGGNVLFAEDQPPAVIDFSPYWRPAGYASAIVVADAVAWYGARPSLLATVDRQLLIRAVLFRLLCAADLEAARREFRPALQALAA